MKTLNKYALTNAPSPDVARTYGQLLDTQVRELSELLDGFTDRVRDVRQSGRYTAAGVADELKKLGRATLADLDRLSEHPPKKLALDLSKVQAPSRLPTFRELAKERDEEPVVMFLRHQEIRQYLRSVDPLLQRPLLLDAATANDLDLLVAASDVHAAVRPVRADTLAEAVESWLAARRPPEANIIAATQTVYVSNVQTAKRLIASDTGIVADDPIARAAAA